MVLLCSANGFYSPRVARLGHICQYSPSIGLRHHPTWSQGRKSEKMVRHFETVSFFYKTMHYLGQHASVFAEDFSALDSLLSLSPDIEAYRGKGSQILSADFVRLLQCITFLAIGEIPIEEPRSPDAKITDPFKRISSYALGQVIGKRVHSKRAADLRGDYWQILEDIVEEFYVQEIIELARRVACDEKASTPERRGALSCLLLKCDGNEADKETQSIIEQIRKNPPDRDTLFMILDAEVNLGILSKMAALVELEDWDEENGESLSW
jgi:hypothetical protein